MTAAETARMTKHLMDAMFILGSMTEKLKNVEERFLELHPGAGQRLPAPRSPLPAPCSGVRA